MASEPDVGGLVVDGELGGYVPVLGGGELGTPPSDDPCVPSFSPALPRRSGCQPVVVWRASMEARASGTRPHGPESQPHTQARRGKGTPW